MFTVVYGADIVPSLSFIFHLCAFFLSVCKNAVFR